MGLPWRNSVSEMFVNLNIRSFDELLRMFVFGFRSRIIGYEPADLTCTPPRTAEGGFIFFRIRIRRIRICLFR